LREVADWIYEPALGNSRELRVHFAKAAILIVTGPLPTPDPEGRVVSL
jgi:hypothetical protein